jgi:DNA-binding NarL/FixJ family response regulator
LLVDDSALVRVHMAELLDDVARHVEIRHAGDVPSGVRLMEQRRPDLMILDIDLPGQNGLDLLKIARRKFPDTLIVMMSMHDHPVLRQRCAELGASFFFHKTTEFDRIADLCREQAELRAKRTPPSSGSAKE